MLSIMAGGFALGFSLILAIGAQNAFVLRAGLMRRHVLPLVLVCAISDAVLIAAGVAGFGALVQSYPAIVDYLRYFGAAFLVVYGLRAFLSAMRGGSAMERGADENDLWKSIAICLMLTWLNPHVYLDTVVLVGSLAAQLRTLGSLVRVPSVQVSSSFSHWDTVRDSCHLCFKIRVHGKY